MTTHVERVIFNKMETLKLALIRAREGSSKRVVDHYRAQFDLINDLAKDLILIGETEYLDNQMFINDYD